MDFAGGPGVAEVEPGELVGAMKDDFLRPFVSTYATSVGNEHALQAHLRYYHICIPISMVTSNTSCDIFASFVVGLRNVATTMGASCICLPHRMQRLNLSCLDLA